MLLIPVYLNQRIVFDLIAMLQGGISTVTQIRAAEANSEKSGGTVKAGFGLGEALSSLLKIDLSGEKVGEKTNSSDRQVSEERVHTPASLLFTLRQLLLDKKLVKVDSDDTLYASGDIVEFEASLRRNPIIETMDAFAGMLDMASIFNEPQKKSGQGNSYQKIKAQMEKFAESMKTGNSIDLTTDKLSSGYKAVITIDAGYLNDPTMADLVDGQFHVLGKVIKCVVDADESVSLLRKSAVSKLPPATLITAFSQLVATTTEQGFALPEIKWEVNGPAIQVIPIAIFA